MPIPDWVARETRHLHERAFHVLAAMFTDGRREVAEDGTVSYALGEEWPVEELLGERDTVRRVWRQLEARGLVVYRPKDHMALSGRTRGSYVCQDRIAQFSSVPNKDARNCALSSASAPLPAEPFESDMRLLSRAYTRDNVTRDDAGAATRRASSAPSSSASPPPTSPPPPTARGEEITLESALELVGFTEDGEAEELLKGFSANSVAVSLRYLVRGLRRSRKKVQPWIDKPTGYLIEHLKKHERVKWDEVDDYGFLVELPSLLQWWASERQRAAAGTVITFPGRDSNDAG